MPLRNYLIFMILIPITARAAETRARLSTPAGAIELKLLVEEAPVAAGNFIALARQGFYDGSRFHRLRPGHSLVGGAPKGAAAGGPGYCFAGDETARKHTRAGLVSMVSTGPATLGSQFQITLGPAFDLDGVTPIFAEVLSGMETVEKLVAGRLEAATIDKIEVVGDDRPVAFVKVPELDQAGLGAALGPNAKALAATVGKTLGLGKLASLDLVSGRSRCATSQAMFRADFAKARGAQLLVYAHTGDGAPVITQFQFERGVPP